MHYAVDVIHDVSYGVSNTGSIQQNGNFAIENDAPLRRVISIRSNMINSFNVDLIIPGILAFRRCYWNGYFQYAVINLRLDVLDDTVLRDIP